MNPSNTIFTYTAKRAAYFSTIAALLFIMLAEGSLTTYVITLFIHNGWFKLLPIGAVAILYTYICIALLAPSFTRHRLSGTHLWLRYGFTLNMHVPLAEIVTAEPVHEQLNMLQPLRATHDAKKQRIVAAFSDHGQVLIRLQAPRMFKFGRTNVPVQTILLNVDQRDEFLAALRNKSTNAPTAVEAAKNFPASSPPLQHEFERVPTFSKNISLKAVESDNLAIRTEMLTRTFKSFNAVENLNLAIHEGEIYGFLGANGAGKTTTMKMLVGLLEPSSGQAWIAGHNVWTEPLAAKAAFGYVADRAILYERLTGREFLDFLAQLRGTPLKQANERVEHFLDILELADHAHRPCGAYSFGMKRKLALAGALLHQPPVLILDEPLNGLDPRSARRLKDLFIERANSGTTILLSTHDLATAETVCHRVGIIHRGRLLAEGSAGELEQMASASDLESVFLSLTSAEDSLPQTSGEVAV